ncbi:Hypothetical protein SMAX5B_000380 [Scophthalmus maximus]|uniref:Uncharacterized protein n=1 Tax=Scophthalmus maximus TaxID=52904 RepID=A0A2U9CPC9_SCOMX|nr:Hypothetical protein SMAX5B_000380 [Scophthalmus maximus]
MGMCRPVQALKAEWSGGEEPCPTNSFSKAPPQTAFSPHSPPAPKCPSNSFSVSTMNPGSLSHCAIPTTAASHLGRRRGRLCCYTAPICPLSFHAVDHDAAAWLSGRRKDFGKSSSEIPPLLVSAFPQPASLPGPSGVAGAGWDGAPPELVLSYGYNTRATTHSSSR